VEFRGTYRIVRRKDRAVPVPPPRALFAGDTAGLDLRAWRREGLDRPLLLVNAPKKSGPAVARNRFKRRVRAALHGLLQDAAPAPFILWVRPARGARCTQTYAEIQAQLRRALERLQPKASLR
jgi:ribonuclease P protein component